MIDSMESISPQNIQPWTQPTRGPSITGYGAACKRRLAAISAIAAEMAAGVWCACRPYRVIVQTAYHLLELELRLQVPFHSLCCHVASRPLCPTVSMVFARRAIEAKDARALCGGPKLHTIEAPGGV